MAAETAELRKSARKVKDHILRRFIRLAERVDEKGTGDLSDKELIRYEELTDIFAKSVLPRTVEASGEDGEAIQHVIKGVNYIVPKDPNKTDEPDNVETESAVENKEPSDGNNTEANMETAPSVPSA